MEQSFLKELFSYKRPQENPFKIIGAGFCMLLILSCGYYLHNFTIASFGSMGIFTFLYYQNLPLKQLVIRLSTIGIFLLGSNLLGMVATHLLWLTPLAVGIIAACGRLFFRLYDISKPGAFFAVMVSAMGASTKLPLEKIPLMSGYFFLGILLAVITAILVHFTERDVSILSEQQSFHFRLQKDPAAFIDSLFYGAVLFLAVYLSQGLQLQNPYWLVISCAAILQGDNLRAMLHRNIQRIGGSIVGLGISAVLLNLPLTQFQTVLMITFLFVIVEYFIKRNYAIGNFFTTPMALMLSMLARHQYVSSLIQFRFLGIVLGSLLGLGAAWLFTTGLKFYNRTLHLTETLDRETD